MCRRGCRSGKALASGDPLILEKAAADAERTRLERLQRAYQRNQHALTRTITSAESRFDRSARELTAVAAAIARSVDTRGDAFGMTIGDRRVTTRPEAARLIQEWTAQAARHGVPYGRREQPLGQLGELGGQPIDAALRKTIGSVPALELSVRDVPTPPATLDLDEVRRDALSLVRQLEHRVSDLPALAGRVDAAGVQAADEAARAEQARAQPFKHADALAAATARSSAIAIEMRDRQQPDSGAAVAQTAQPASATDAELAELKRLTRANFPSPPAAGTPAAAALTPRRAAPPARENDVSR